MRSPQFVITETKASTVDRGHWRLRPLNMHRDLLDVTYRHHHCLVRPDEVHCFIREDAPDRYSVWTQVGDIPHLPHLPGGAAECPRLGPAPLPPGRRGDPMTLHYRIHHLGTPAASVLVAVLLWWVLG